MPTYRGKHAALAAVAFLLTSIGLVSGQEATESGKPRFTSEQHEALAALYEHGGILINLDEQRPGRPVVMIDFTGHPEFQDDWLKHLLPFTELTTVRLAGTALTDAGLDYLKQLPKLKELVLSDTGVTDVGLSKLADCKTLGTLAVSGTRVTEAGTNALCQALPQLKIITETVKRFSAAEIKKWRERLTELGQLPQNTLNGWSKSPVDPTKLLTVFPKLSMREGYAFRAYVFKEDANSNGFVWALPVDAEYPEPNDCPRLESHFLKPPKPFDALDDLMETIAGDDRRGRLAGVVSPRFYPAPRTQGVWRRLARDRLGRAHGTRRKPLERFSTAERRLVPRSAFEQSPRVEMARGRTDNLEPGGAPRRESGDRHLLYVHSAHGGVGQR